MGDLKEIYSQFKKSELLDITKELEMSVDASTPITVVTEAILTDIDTNGVPEDLEDISDILFEFLVVAGYIDEEGNILEKEEVAEQKTVVEVEEEIPDWICFSYYEVRDPACKVCKLAARCEKARISKRPECFGISYNQHEPECQMCIEAPYCMEKMKEI